MIQFLLVPALLCVGLEEPRQHAAFHPAEVDVFVEAADVAALIRAYEKAPIVQLFNDPATAKLADVAKEAGLDVRRMIQDLLPVADATRPEDRFWPWSAATAISISVAELNPKTTSTEAPSKLGRGCVVVDFKNAADAEQAVKALVATVGAEHDNTEGAMTLSLDARQVPVVRLANAKVVRPWLARDGARLIGGFGGVEPNELANRIAKPETSFVEKHKQLVDDAGLKANCGVTIVRAWSELSQLPKDLLPSMSAADAVLVNTFVPGFLPFVGQKGRYRLQMCGDRFVSESLVERIGAAKQLDDLYGTGEIPVSTARLVPKDAVGVWLLKFQPAQFEALLERTLAGMSGAAPPKPDDKAPKLSDTVGDSAAMFLMPLEMKHLQAGAPSAVLSVPLKEGAPFKAALEAWIERAKLADPKLKVESKPYHKMPMYTFTFGKAPADGDTSEPSMRPTITILADRVLVTPQKSTAQAEVRRAEAPSTDAHPIAAENAIPKGAFEVSTMDWAATLGKLYDLGRAAAPMLLGQGREQPLDLEALPTASTLFRFFRPSLSFTQRVDGKTYTYSESSFGPEIPLGLALSSIGFSNSSTLKLGGELQAGTPMPATEGTAPKRSEKVAEQKPVVEPERDATVKALRAVRVGLTIYKSQFQRAPNALDDLLKGTDAFPKGFLEGTEVPKDGWGRGLVYAVRENGAKYDLRSVGPNGVDDQGAGDDILLP